MNKENKTKFIRQSDFFLLLSFMEMKMIANNYNYRLKTKHKIIKEEKKYLDHFMVKTKKSTITNETKLCIVPCYNDSNFKTHVVKILNINDPHSKFQSFTQQSIVSSSRI